MKSIKKTAEAVPSSSGQKSINKQLTVQHINTPRQIGQFNFASYTRIFTAPEKERRGRSRCYGCLRWVEKVCAALWQRPQLSPIQYGVCEKCRAAISIMPPGLARAFAEKCERNLKNALGVRNDG